MKIRFKFLALVLGFSLLAISNVQAAASVTFYHHDALGSVIATSNKYGDLDLNEEYQPYGEKIYGTEDFSSGNEDWYTGKNYSKELDLTYFGARWYDAKQGRFLSMDPAPVNLANIHSFNRYHYGNNNPYKYVDPDGNAPISVESDSDGDGIPNAIDDSGSGSAIQRIGDLGPRLLNGPDNRFGGGISAAKSRTTVIGRVKDLQNLKKWEQSLLNRLPDRGGAKANWKQNSGVVRQEISKGKPIRDASPGDIRGQFLNAERNLLRDRGWILDSRTNNWTPPNR